MLKGSEVSQQTSKVNKMKFLLFMFGLFLLSLTVSAAYDFYLNEHETMRFLGELQQLIKYFGVFHRNGNMKPRKLEFMMLMCYWGIPVVTGAIICQSIGFQR